MKTAGRSDFLFIAGCRAASAETRATAAREGGHYLFPMPMTGDNPLILKEPVLNRSEKPQEIILIPKAGEEEEEGQRKAGAGFVTETRAEGVTEDGIPHKWQERRMIIRSDAHAERQKKGIKDRPAKAETELTGLKPKKKETAETFLKRAESILKDCKVAELITLTVSESVHHKKKYTGRGVRVPAHLMK